MFIVLVLCVSVYVVVCVPKKTTTASSRVSSYSICYFATILYMMVIYSNQESTVFIDLYIYSLYNNKLCLCYLWKFWRISVCWPSHMCTCIFTCTEYNDVYIIYLLILIMSYFWIPLYVYILRANIDPLVVSGCFVICNSIASIITNSK